MFLSTQYLEKRDDPVNIPIIVLSIGLVMLLVEVLRPGRQYRKPVYWWPRAILLNAIQAGSAVLAARTWDLWLPQFKLIDLSGLALLLQVIIGYVVLTFIYYWWHRARHEVPYLWRTLHQIHHSPARLEVITSFYKHPIEILSNSVISSAIVYSLLGLVPAAVIVVILITGLAELFYHWNVKTPYWLGYIIQRPESHCVHHKQGYHRNNYSDLPIWDMLFGTFENPRYQPEDCGFDEPRELALWSMLRAKNLYETAEQESPK